MGTDRPSTQVYSEYSVRIYAQKKIDRKRWKRTTFALMNMSDGWEEPQLKIFEEYIKFAAHPPGNRASHRFDISSASFPLPNFFFLLFFLIYFNSAKIEKKGNGKPNNKLEYTKFNSISPFVWRRHPSFVDYNRPSWSPNRSGGKGGERRKRERANIMYAVFNRIERKSDTIQRNVLIGRDENTIDEDNFVFA